VPYAAQREDATQLFNSFTAMGTFPDVYRSRTQPNMLIRMAICIHADPMAADLRFQSAVVRIQDEELRLLNGHMAVNAVVGNSRAKLRIHPASLFCMAAKTLS
jgi:hypothetical protein